MVPVPKESDFALPESDIYSEQCTELLDNLESVIEETETDFKMEMPVPQQPTTKPNVNTAPSKTNKNEKNIQNEKNINLNLKLLELKEDHIELPKNQQKLTTPGMFSNFQSSF